MKKENKNKTSIGFGAKFKFKDSSLSLHVDSGEIYDEQNNFLASLTTMSNSGISIYNPLFGSKNINFSDITLI